MPRMKRVLNSHTNTVHRPHHGSQRRETQCGALTQVATEQIRHVQSEELQPATEITHCGRCFDDSGGY